ncbi:MAG: S8 family serine peptidase [Ekhidna sp.]
MNRFLGVLIVVLIGATQGWTQTASDTSRYFVYFQEKLEAENYPFTTNAPQAFLSQRSIDRRNKHGIAITEEDLPVHPGYVQSLREEEVDVFFTSRWLNGALVQTHTNKIAGIEALDFVDSVRLIAEGPRLRYKKQQVAPPASFDTPPGMTGDSNIQLGMIGGLFMHSEDIKGQGMIIAVLDNGYTGVNRFEPFEHVWENNQIIATKDFVENSGNVFQYGSHGTAVFSIIGAKYETDTTEFIGVAPEASYVLCVTEDNKAENTIEEYNWLLGAEFADSVGADVINGSLGYRLFDIAEHNYDYDDLDGNTAVVALAAQLASEKGMVVVVSAGNEGDNLSGWRYITSPADAAGALTVGSVDVNFERSLFSSIGPTSDGRIKPDVAAFGNGTTVMRGNGLIERGSGTSFASPVIAGLAACIWQINPERTSWEIISALKKSGHQSEKPDTLLGHGVPNYIYAKEVKALNINDILADKVSIYPNPFRGDTLFLRTEGSFNEGMSIKVLDPKGTLIYNRTFEQAEVKDQMELSFDGSMQGVYFLFLQTENDHKVVKLINF